MSLSIHVELHEADVSPAALEQHLRVIGFVRQAALVSTALVGIANPPPAPSDSDGSIPTSPTSTGVVGFVAPTAKTAEPEQEAAEPKKRGRKPKEEKPAEAKTERAISTGGERVNPEEKADLSGAPEDNDTEQDRADENDYLEDAPEAPSVDDLRSLMMDYAETYGQDFVQSDVSATLESAVGASKASLVPEAKRREAWVALRKLVVENPFSRVEVSD